MARRISPRKRALIDEISRPLGSRYPSLSIVEIKPRVVVRGWFPVRLKGKTLDRFRIEIEFPNDYPKSVPIVREIGNRIPRELDRHCMSDGAFCLFVPDEQWRYWGEAKNLGTFLAETVNDFLLGQIYFEQNGDFPFGERGHGAKGIYEYYGEELGTHDRKVIEQCIKYLC